MPSDPTNTPAAAMVADVYVRRSDRGRYRLVEVGLPVEEAYARVHSLRSDPTVVWAYCTQRRDSETREDWSEASVKEMRDRLDAIGPPWGNSELLAAFVIEGFWIAYEALERLEAESNG